MFNPTTINIPTDDPMMYKGQFVETPLLGALSLQSISSSY